MVRGKYLNEITIALLALTGVMVLLSAGMLVSGAKKLTAIYAETAAIPLVTPLLSRQVTPYSPDEYQTLRQKLVIEAPLRVEVVPEGLKVLAPTVTDEGIWRQAVAAVLAGDKNLRVAKVCGSATNACSGVALVAEIAGQRQRVIATN